MLDSKESKGNVKIKSIPERRNGIQEAAEV